MTLRNCGAVWLLLAAFATAAAGQATEPLDGLLSQFDIEHDLAAKEHLLLALTNQHPEAGPVLLGLAESTKNSDTRWMAMRGLVALHYRESAAFLEASLKDSDKFVRANAARSLGDLRITKASVALLAMFIKEQDPPAVEQASLAIRLLGIKAARPEILRKIGSFRGQTRAWLLQALGTVGNLDDVPLVASFLNDDKDAGSEFAASEALGELVGTNFGGPGNGLISIPPPYVLAARAWWTAHKDAWPRCDDCRRK